MWNTMHGDRKKTLEEGKDEPIAEGDLVGNFVRRTDNEFKGIEDPSLIGKDIGDDEDEDEAGEDR